MGRAGTCRANDGADKRLGAGAKKRYEALKKSPDLLTLNDSFHKLSFVLSKYSSSGNYCSSAADRDQPSIKMI